MIRYRFCAHRPPMLFNTRSPHRLDALIPGFIEPAAQRPRVPRDAADSRGGGTRRSGPVDRGSNRVLDTEPADRTRGASGDLGPAYRGLVTGPEPTSGETRPSAPRTPWPPRANEPPPVAAITVLRSPLSRRRRARSSGTSAAWCGTPAWNSAAQHRQRGAWDEVRAAVRRAGRSQARASEHTLTAPYVELSREGDADSGGSEPGRC